MKFGVDYYPEHWEKKLWESDIQRMLEAGIQVVRIAEFAWTIMEKAEGDFDFSLFDKIIENLGKNGINVILGTPTATPPAWLCSKYPDVLRMNNNGVRISFGARRHYCYNNPHIKRLCASIVTQMAKQYKDNPYVIAWQIDNEMAHEASDKCYCPECRDAFSVWLKEKYETLETLNYTWGTVFWSQQYTDWKQIPVPSIALVAHNPTLELDYYRFCSDSIINFAKIQIDILRNIIPENIIITHNLVSQSGDVAFNKQKFSNQIDIASYDNYPVWGGLEKPIMPYENAYQLDEVRGYKNSNFWVMEQLAGAQGHRILGFLPRPGQMKLWSYQAATRGAEALIYFRWRAAHFGAEQFCHGIIDHDNIPKRKYYELKNIICEITEESKILNAPSNAQIGLLHNYDNMWAWDIQPLSTAMNYKREMIKFYRPLFDCNVPSDIIFEDSDFSKYKIIVAPILFLASEMLENKLKNFVENGGTLVLSYRTGVKNINNIVNRTTLPGAFREISGIKIDEYESLQNGQQVKIRGAQGVLKEDTFTADVWTDYLLLETAQEIAVYDGGATADYNVGKTAISVNKYKNGSVYYIGTSLNHPGLMDLYGIIFKNCGICSIDSPEGVEVVKKSVADKNYYVVMNHNNHDAKLTLDNKNYLLSAYECLVIGGREK